VATHVPLPPSWYPVEQVPVCTHVPLPPSWYPVWQVSLPGKDSDVTQKSNVLPVEPLTTKTICVAVGAPVRWVAPSLKLVQAMVCDALVIGA